jgi:RNA polymerase sigma factor (sigma-70 family)
VNALPPKERVVFFMRHVDGLDQVSIAQALRFSKGYVSKLLKRAARELERAGWEVHDER